MGKKFARALVAGCLATGLVFNQAAFAEVVKTSVMPKPPTEINGDLSKAKFPLDKAIERAKEVFRIGSEYESFKSGFNSYDGKAEWHLNWNRDTEPRGNISVRVDALTGDIIGMDRWQDMPPGQRYSGLPKYSYEEATKLAQEWAKKLLPHYVSQTRLDPNRERPFFGFGERGPVEYYYNFARVVNGVSFPEHNIHVRVNGDTGEIMGFHLNWDNKLNFPSVAGKISATQAEKVFGENVELVYFRPHMSGTENPPVKLIYQVKNGAGLLIDALTGKVIDEPRYFYDKAGGMGGDNMAIEERKEKQELSPVEQKEVDKLKNLLSTDKALEQVKKALQIPADLKQTESRLSQDYQYPEQTQWNFHWRSEKEAAYQSINASVNAVTGELVSFNKWMRSYDETAGKKPQFTKEQAQKAAEDFIKKQQSRRFGEIKLQNSWNENYIEKGMPGIYRFSYVRLVNNIPFTNNGFDVEVNAYTGEVTSYRMSWWNVSFPQPAGLLDKGKAVESFLGDGGLALDYMRIHRGSNEPRINLVYRLKDRPSYMVDAQTGKFLNWNGEPIAPKQTNQFTDIAGHPSENDILQLAKANIVKSADGKFHPNRNITKLEALEMLVASRGWYMEPPYRIMQDSKEQEEQKKKIIDAAVSLGIIAAGETKDLDIELSRLEMARLMINTLDYDGAAKVSGIYTLKTKDANLIPAAMKGYVALSLGLGLQSDNKGYFNPNGKVSRGLAATSLVRMLKVQK
ncbi:MAG: YcdB/YcdC domain-containing protein [Bacillota bacterium]